MSDTTAVVPSDSGEVVVVLFGMVTIAAIISLIILCSCKRNTKTPHPCPNGAMGALIVGLLSGLAYLICHFALVIYRRNYRQKCQQEAQANQTNGNLSGRVPGQNAPPYPDAYRSSDHIMVENELNKSQKCSEAPPSYEEAMKLALAHSNSLQTYEVEQGRTNQQLEANQGTSSATPVAPTHQPTAVPNERF